jgi:hypothetical protein
MVNFHHDEKKFKKIKNKLNTDNVWGLARKGWLGAALGCWGGCRASGSTKPAAAGAGMSEIKRSADSVSEASELSANLAA